MDLTLLARDGSVIEDVYEQLKHLPKGATQLIVSVGGNDAVSHWPLLDEPAGHVRDGLIRLGAVVAEFAEEYAALLDAMVATALPFTVCTIYEGDFSEFGDQDAINAAVAIFDSEIHRAAAGRLVPVIELRNVCTSPQSFTQTIEPSAIGSRAIASAIARFVAPGR